MQASDNFTVRLGFSVHITIEKLIEESEESESRDESKARLSGPPPFRHVAEFY